MNLKAQSELIDEMIKENPDQTIKDFLELKQEIENIQSTEKAPMYEIEAIS